MSVNIKAERLKGGLQKLAQTASRNKDSVSGTVILVKPSDCFEEGNPRTDFDQHLIEAYAEDFLNPSIGQEEAIHLYPANGSGKYRVQHGATRLRAGLIAESKNPAFRLKAIVDDSLVQKDELENYLNRGMNNIKRDNMSLRDRANFIGTYLDEAKKGGKSVSQADVAKRLGLKGGATYISRLLKLRDMTPELERIYESGKTDDVEALSLLAEIQKESPDLFASLAEMPDLDRATIRRAKKNGVIVTPTKTVSQEVKSFAHAQSAAERKADEATDIIAFMDYIFTTGRVNILIKKTAEGYLGALETLFAHGILSDKSFSDSPLHSSENDAVEYVKTLVAPWAELVTADPKAVSVEEYRDAKGYLQSLTKSGKEESPNNNRAPVAKKNKRGEMKATIFGEVDGEECQLLLNITHDVIGADMKDKATSGFVWVSINGVVKLCSEKDFVLKHVVYQE